MRLWWPVPRPGVPIRQGEENLGWRRPDPQPGIPIPLPGRYGISSHIWRGIASFFVSSLAVFRLNCGLVNLIGGLNGCRGPN